MNLIFLRSGEAGGLTVSLSLSSSSSSEEEGERPSSGGRKALLGPGSGAIPLRDRVACAWEGRPECLAKGKPLAPDAATLETESSSAQNKRTSAPRMGA